MGLRRALRLVDADAGVRRDATAVEASLGVVPEIRSPWSNNPSTLETVVWADVFGADADLLPLTRASAIAVPSVAKARHVICPQIADRPLRAFRGETRIDDPLWSYRSDDGVSPWHRMTWTADDCLFYGWSLWLARRGARPAGSDAPGPLLGVSRVAPTRWKFEEDWTIKVDDEPIPADLAIVIPGPHEGILQIGRRGIRHAAAVLQAAENAALLPSPTFELHQTAGDPMDDTERDAMLDQWAAARQGKRGGVAYTSSNIETKEHKSVADQLLIEGRNAAAVEVARICGIAAGMIDATVAKASLNYETTQGRGLEHNEYGIEPYARAIAARLSLDDVTARGTRVAFDLSGDLGELSPTGPTEED